MEKVLCSPPGSETESETGVESETERRQRSAEGTNRVQGAQCRVPGAGCPVQGVEGALRFAFCFLGLWTL